MHARKGCGASGVCRQEAGDVAQAASLPQDLASQALALSQAAPQLLQRPTSLQRQSSSFAETTMDGEQANSAVHMLLLYCWAGCCLSDELSGADG